MNLISNALKFTMQGHINIILKSFTKINCIKTDNIATFIEH